MTADKATVDVELCEELGCFEEDCKSQEAKEGVLVLMLCAARKKVADLVDDVGGKYKCAQNKIVQIESLTNVRDALVAEREQMKALINALTGIQNYLNFAS